VNLYRQFRQLIPDEPLLVGEVLSHEADGTSAVELPGGAIIRARGQTVAVANKAFVRGGVIEGEAPDLPVEMIEV
jgi:hypothetical protein